MDGESDSVKIARIDVRTTSMEQAMRDHLTEDTRRFEMVFSHFNTRLDRFEQKMDDRLTKNESKQADLFNASERKHDDLVKDKVQPLWDDKNNREGAVDASKWIIGGLGGILGAVITSGYIAFAKPIEKGKDHDKSSSAYERLAPKDSEKPTG